MASRTGSRPRYPRARRPKQRSVWYDLFLDAKRHVSPRKAPRLRHFGIARSQKQVEMIARHDLPFSQIGNAHNTAEPEIRVALQMVDEILAREVFFRGRSLNHIFVAEVTVHVDFRRHDRLARQVDVCRICGNCNLALPADGGELVILDDECGILDGRAAIACNKERPLEHGGVGPNGLARRRRRAGRCREQTRGNQKMSGRPGAHRT